MDAYIYLVSAVAFVGWSGCLYFLGRIDGARDEKKRAAKVRRMARRETR